MNPTTAPAAQHAPVAADEAFFREAWPGLVRLGRLITGSQELAEDLAQEAIAGLIRQGRDVSEPQAYLRRSVVNLSTNHFRRQDRERRHLGSVGLQPAVDPPETDEMWPLILALPARQRTVLVLRYYEDLSEAEIARVLDCRPGTVKSLASRALDALRKDIQP